MEPDVIRIYSSSPPPMEDGAEEDDAEFGDFGTFSGVPNSISFSEFDTPTTFNQTQALNATSPPEILNNRGVVGFSHSSSNGTHTPNNELSKANGVVPPGHLGSSPSERTEMKKVLASSLDLSAGSEPVDCNGGGTEVEVLTNGFAPLDTQGSPSSQNSVHSHTKGTSTGDNGCVPVQTSEDDFADFAAFSNAEGHLGQTANEDLDIPTGDSWPAESACPEEHCNIAQGTTSEDDVRDTNRTGPNTCGSDSLSVPAEAADGSCDTDRVSHTDADSHQRDVAFASEAVCTNEPLHLNGVDVADGEDSKDAAVCSENDLSPDAAADAEAGQSDEKGSGNETETETETETSFGRPLSTDALEEYADMSTTGSVPSPPLQGETTTPADHSQLVEDDMDEDFGDFGDAGSFSGQGFADFEQLDVQPEPSRLQSSAPEQEAANAKEEDDFGDFNSPKFHTAEKEAEDGGTFADFPVSDSFGNFSSAAEGAAADDGAGAGWSAFGEQQQQAEEAEGESWAAFSTEQSVRGPADCKEEEREEKEEEEEEDEWHESEAPAGSEDASGTDRQTALLSSRLEKLFQSSFPPTAAVPVPMMEEDVVVSSLKDLLEPPEGRPQPGAKEEETETAPGNSLVRCGVWSQLQDIHEAIGLRYQWGGSHCNKALLCCLGIDTRNILFTGQKKQPVIVPMYAASLGMLEPTKEPVKPVSAAEMIASIAQAPPAAPEKPSSCPPDTQQEALPPVQFDWSSSGLTNPLDASGGSSLLNLDFFGPVEDSGSTSSTSIPGVDPELYELTTAKLDPGSSGSRVADAFARLMSTMEKTSTSTRKPRREENLSEEASKVISGLPDLSFMQAKVLMFPATLTPLSSAATPD
ncbi:aftiphilin a isoform X2 [Notolabrus celidotus]|uniref:aftiphilin a isoform X2 n=1 Tax=Notolabrus celidotus TaxID=1203425 RepID=UPI0014901FE6|nr:aftiphilin a isoform X2 [Notolabrus celidotus]